MIKNGKANQAVDSNLFPEWPVYDDSELKAVEQVVKSRIWWRRDGSEVSGFEKAFAEYHECKYGLAVSNGTQAIEIALASLGIGAGDEVILPCYTFASSISAVLLMGAVPVLVDVLGDTYCIDPKKVSDALTSRTRAIMPVHIGGHIADMNALREIAIRAKVPILEDAAQAHGAEWKGQRVGALGNCGIFSFQSAKLMTAGEGGIIVTNDEELHRKFLLYSNCGRTEHDRVYNHEVVGTNARMTEFQGALLQAQLSRFDSQVSHRENNARILVEELSVLPGIHPQKLDPRVTRHARYVVMFRYDQASFNGLSRDGFVEQLNTLGVPALIAYRPIHQLPFMVNRKFGPRWKLSEALLPDFSKMDFPISESIGEEVVCIHHRTLLGNEHDMREIIRAIESIRASSALLAQEGGKWR